MVKYSVEQSRSELYSKVSTPIAHPLTPHCLKNNIILQEEKKEKYYGQIQCRTE